MAEKKLSVEELLAKANKPGEDAMKLHPFYRGKVEVVPKCCVRDFDDFAIWYTPGVAKPCKDIEAHPEKVFEHTNKANFVAVITDGTRVLGLGDIGPEAGMPVMEGKALLFKYLGGVDAFPLCLDTKDPDKFIETCMILQPSFGGFNLEDISQPKCFYILEELRKKARIPVWHDDQQGTAAVTTAGLLNAAKVVGKDFNNLKLVMLGIGGAGSACLRVMVATGLEPSNIRVLDLVDGKPTILTTDMNLEKLFPYRSELLSKTNVDKVKGGMDELFKGMDAVIGYAGPGLIKPEHIKSMGTNPIVFACANPVPEIWPWEAKEAGAKVIATGRSDFPNQVNNSIGFPGIFRGTLDVMATTITDEMCIAAAQELAKCAEDKGLHEEYIIPSMGEWEVFPREAVAVGLKAIEQGVARIKLSKDELMKMAEEKIKRARDETHALMKDGFIPLP
ncbi:NADP-dependent malic enzyme [candidate division WOR-3 bacterium]|nr:NADP-dependent malic enzyme [candidate division WOR-3 bacterium]